MRFILAVISGELKINNRKKADIVADLDSMGYDRIAPAKKVCLVDPHYHTLAVIVQLDQLNL